MPCGAPASVMVPVVAVVGFVIPRKFAFDADMKWFVLSWLTCDRCAKPLLSARDHRTVIAGYASKAIGSRRDPHSSFSVVKLFCSYKAPINRQGPSLRVPPRDPRVNALKLMLRRSMKAVASSCSRHFLSCCAGPF